MIYSHGIRLRIALFRAVSDKGFHRTTKLYKWPGFLNQAIIFMVSITNSFSMNPYVCLIILAAVFYELNINIVKEYLFDVHSLHISTVAVSFTGILGLLFLIISGYEPYIEIHWNQVVPLL